ncbi:aminopeptidase N [Dasania marina]|uniref:aminopeptidase N n=1 Tax=Dasania marina TaxID=471499 RepID=UPI0030D6DA21|tara:strand:+ start:172463 stop:175165 length:2703 start_codon:yes stop_codon:yes gene_type:complete
MNNKISRHLTVLLLAVVLVACGDKKSEQPDNSKLLRGNEATLSGDYAALRKQQILAVDYQLSVVLDKQSPDFSGQVLINFELAASNREPITVDFNQGQVLAISVNGRTAQWHYNNYFISLAPELFKAGKNTLAIEYQHAYGSEGLGLHRFQDPENNEVYLYTDFEPYEANKLFPHFDQPNLKASYVLDVVAPSQWQVVSVMRENSVSEDATASTRHWHFPASAKISSYVFALHAGPYHVWEAKAGDIPLRLFARNSLAPYVKTDDWFHFTQQSFAFFNDYFDFPYPFYKYDQIIVPDFNSGAMENVGAVTFSEAYVSRGEKSSAQRLSLANVIAHEMAHMWFGNLVTMDWWNGLWLNESFATYMANLQLEQASDFENTWDSFYFTTKLWAYDTDQQVTTHAIELPVATTDDAFTNFDGITYGKGASVLKQLSHYLGAQQFRAGVRQYLKAHAYQNTTLADFMSALAQAADKNLDDWQQQWLYQTGLNTVELAFSCEQGKVTTMALLQTAPSDWPTLRQQRVQVGLYQLQGEAMQLQDLMAVTYSGSRTELPQALGQACPMLAYPNVGDWGYVAVRLDARSLQTLKQHINDFESAGMRMMLWQNMWQSVREAELALTDYIDFALANIAGERDLNTTRLVGDSLLQAYDYLQRLSHQATITKDLQLALSQRAAAIENMAWQQLSHVEPGSDLQKQWFTLALNTSHSPAVLKKARALLLGHSVIEGISIDQDRRWQLVGLLNQYLYADYQQLLNAEVHRDSSDLGAKMAIYAEAVRPLPEAKAKWFQHITASLLDDSASKKYKLSDLRYAMQGLFPAEQNAFMQSYNATILAMVSDLNERASPQALSSFVGNLMPAACNPQSVKLLQQAVQDFKDYQPVVSKAFKIGLQEDQRCVAIVKRLQP